MNKHMDASWYWKACRESASYDNDINVYKDLLVITFEYAISRKDYI